MSKNHFNIIALMSGSSLDGLDIAHVKLHFDKKWSYDLQECETIPFSKKWITRLKHLKTQSAEILAKTDQYFGIWCGEQVNEFIVKYNLTEIDFISSHGHTVFHEPKTLFTCQIGSGAAISAKTNLTCIADFRRGDVVLGGEGAPFAPIVDKVLFPEYKYFLNLGGIANVTINDNKTLGFDICACNQILNFFAEQAGFEYDKNGDLAKEGNLNQKLFEALNQWEFCQKNTPKSLDKAEIFAELLPIFNQFELSINDFLHTFCHHIAYQIQQHLKTKETVFISGGGAMNGFLMDLLRNEYEMKIHLPDTRTIFFKECVLMAIMGALRYRNETNILASVTGAKRNSIGGAIYI